jgi:hypothetical protein
VQTPGAPPPRETPKQRRDRELLELLNELRLATPGVQLVFGFLLIVPFNQRFAEATDFQRGLYVLSLVLTAVATILLIGASVQHRLLFRRHFEKRMLPIANRISLIGLTCLGLGMISALVLVTHFVFGPLVATVIGSLVGLLMVSVWYALPLVRARTAERSGVDDQ